MGREGQSACTRDPATPRPEHHTQTNTHLRRSLPSARSDADPRNRRAGRGTPAPKAETVLEFMYESDSSAATASERDSEREADFSPIGIGGAPDTPPSRKGTLLIPSHPQSHSAANPLTHRGDGETDRTYHVL